jgi:SAM-dependent methyltransferase
VDARLQRRIQRYGWDRAVPHYEAGWREALAPARSLLLELAGLEPGERVLDVACGTGLVSLAAARALGPSGLLLGTDISEEMVRAAAALEAPPEAAPMRFERMDAERLLLPDQDFDAALCALGLMYVPDVGAALGELWRVLRPGGRAVAAVWGDRRACGWAEIFPIVDRRVRSEVCPLFFQLGTKDSLAHAFARAGFGRIELHRIDTVLAYPDARSALRAAFDAGPVALAASRFDARTRLEAEREYLESVEPWREGQGYRVPGEFVLARGFRPEIDDQARIRAGCGSASYARPPPPPPRRTPRRRGRRPVPGPGSSSGRARGRGSAPCPSRRRAASPAHR